MIVRLVRMKIKSEKLDEFKRVYEEACNRIRGFSGCTFLQLLQSIDDDSIVFTISHWRSTDDLETYRHSDLFRGVWKQVKPMFREKAWAQSTTVLIDSSRVQ